MLVHELGDADPATVLVPGTYSVRVEFRGRIIVGENEAPTIGDVVVGVIQNMPADWEINNLWLSSPTQEAECPDQQ